MMTCSKHNQIKFWGTAPCANKLKCKFQAKRTEPIWFILFEVLRVPYLGGTSVYPQVFRRIHTKIYGTQGMLQGNKLYCTWLSWWDFPYVLSTGYFPFLVGQRYSWKDSERPPLQAAVIIFIWFSHALSLLWVNIEKVNFVDEQFLYKKINNKDVYVDYGATENISEDAWS